MRFGHVVFGCLMLCLFAVASQSLHAADAPLNFEDDIVPILQARCFSCHGSETRKGGLDLRRKFTIVAGGDGGAAIEPGKPDESLLIEKIVSKEMPPKGEDPLDARQIELLKRWVKAGAATKLATEMPLETKDDDSTLKPEDRQFWIYQPPVRRDPPTVKAPDRVRTPIDAFLLQKLEAVGLTFNADASREVLLRRLCFDLTGLPPTPEQRTAFLQDARPDAYEQLVEALLASPHHGERWGRHWLDVAGYADSDGYLEADRERAEAWRYRDYVIQAHNRDLPYDQFIREQIAGDELSDWRRAPELTPEMRDQLIATGFLRTASDPTYPGYKEKPEIFKVMADTTHILSSAFFGVTLQCARCHSHKSEPISQRDYYQIHAVLVASYDPARWLASSERAVPLATEAEQAEVEQHNKQIADRVKQLTDSMQAIRMKIQQKLVAQKLDAAARAVQSPVDVGGTINADWTLQFSGTANGWKTAADGQKFVIQEIDGKPGYATVLLKRPVALAGEFRAELGFGWTSNDDNDAGKNTAMQVLLVNLRDAKGDLIASHGYVDENNNKRGSAVGRIGIGPDLIEQQLKEFQQAATPGEFAHALSPSGRATVTIVRSADGIITSTFNDGQRTQVITGSRAGTVAEVELEFRRYITPPGTPATFEGLTLENFFVTGPSALQDATVVAAVRAALLIDEKQRNDEQQKLLAERAPRVSLTAADLQKDIEANHPERKIELDKLQAAITTEQALTRSIVQIRGLVDLDDTPPTANVLRRGDFTNLGRVVEPGVPEVLTPADYKYAPLPVYKSTGRRRAFAEWLVNPRHPTTARVHMNRLWSHHFGRGLVDTLDDFGQLGKRPTHPELLDWLATEFIERGWSQKAMHRLMVTSTAYRQTSTLDSAKAAVDGENLLLSAFRPRRHEGEVVRDTLLALSGKLSPKMYGVPVPVVPQADGSISTADTPEGSRRSVYLKVRRSQPVTLLEAFDTPRMEINCNRRTEAIVATQALVLWNSPSVSRAAQTVAGRVLTSAPDRTGRIQWAYHLIFSRDPTDTERSGLLSFLDEFARVQLGDKFAAATPADLATTDAAAWPHIALTLLNANEFLWVD